MKVTFLFLKCDSLIKAGFNTSMTRWQKPFWLLTKQLASGGWLNGHCVHVRVCVHVCVWVCNCVCACAGVCVGALVREELWERNVSVCAVVKSSHMKGCVSSKVWEKEELKQEQHLREWEREVDIENTWKRERKDEKDPERKKEIERNTAEKR